MVISEIKRQNPCSFLAFKNYKWCHIADASLTLSMEQETRDIIELATDIQRLAQRIKAP